MAKKLRWNKHKKRRFRIAMKRLSYHLMHPEIVKRDYDPQSQGVKVDA